MALCKRVLTKRQWTARITRSRILVISTIEIVSVVSPIAMKLKVLGIFFGLASVALAGTTPSDHPVRDVRVSVAFLHPETYSDVGGSRSVRERDGTLKNLSAAMQRSAGDFLRDGLRLEIQVTDIDLAGDVESWRGAPFNDLRIVRDTYPPRMSIDYWLRDSRGRVIARGTTKLSNQNFRFGTLSDLDPLHYDKALFRDWLRNEFAEYRR